MKAILEFDLDDKEDRMAHLRCIKSLDMALLIFHFQYNNRNFEELLEEYNIDIDELTE